MADKYRFKRIKEEIYRIEYHSRQMKILILRDITSRLQRFSRRSRLYGRYSRKRRWNERQKFSILARRRNRRRNFVFTRINVARYSSGGWLLIDQGHGQAGADFLNSFFSALLIKSLIKATSINQNSVSDCCGRVLRCSRQRWGGEDCSRKEVKKTRARRCPVLTSTNRPIKKSSRPQTFAV